MVHQLCNIHFQLVGGVAAEGEREEYFAQERGADALVEAIDKDGSDNFPETVFRQRLVLGVQ